MSAATGQSTAHICQTQGARSYLKTQCNSPVSLPTPLSIPTPSGAAVSSKSGQKGGREKTSTTSSSREGRGPPTTGRTQRVGSLYLGMKTVLIHQAEHFEPWNQGNSELPTIRQHYLTLLRKTRSLPKFHPGAWGKLPPLYKFKKKIRETKRNCIQPCCKRINSQIAHWCLLRPQKLKNESFFNFTQNANPPWSLNIIYGNQAGKQVPYSTFTCNSGTH